MAPHQTGPAPVRASRSRGLSLALAVPALLAAAYFFLVHVPQARRQAVADLERELHLRADERQTAVGGWFNDRLDDVVTVAQFPTVRYLTAPGAVVQGPGIGDGGHMGTVLAPFLKHQGLDALFVSDAAGNVVASARDDPVEPACARASLATAKVEPGAVVAHAHSDGSLVVQFVASIPNGGRVVAESRASTWLCPLVSQRALAAGSAEWRLVHLVGDEVTWVCSSSATGEPAVVRGPMTTPGLASAAALTGAPRFGRFSDLGGGAILAATRPVMPGWGLVLKVDEAEVMASVQRELIRTGTAAGALLLTLVAVAWLAWRSRERAHDLSITRARARLAILLEQANDAIAFVSPKGRVLDVNSRAAAMLGGSRDEVVGKHVHHDLRPPEERDQGRAHLATVLREGYLASETVLQRLDGVSFPAEISSTLVQGEDGPVIVSVVRDIGERRVAQRRMARLNRVLRTLSEVNQLLVTSVTREQLLSRACRAIGETGGFDLAYLAQAEAEGEVRVVAGWGEQAGLLAGHRLRWDNTPLGAGPSGRAIRTRASVVVGDLAADPRVGPWRDIVTASGMRSAASCPILTGDTVYGTLTLFLAEVDAFDAEVVTVLEKLAADLGFGLLALEDRRQRAASDAQFRAVFDSAALGIVLATMAGRPLRANQVFLDMVGYTEAELRAMRFDEFSHPDDALRELPFYEEILAGTRDTYHLEKRYLRKGGGEIWGALTLSTVRDATGAPALFIGLVEDITERRRLQEQFLQAQKMEGIGRLAGGVAHDFNNLLTAILGYAELLRGELGEHHAATPFVDEIGKAGTRAAALTAQLLAFARRQVIEPRVLDLNAVVGDAERMLQRLVGEDVEIVTGLAPDLGAIRADPGQLHQLLVNLAVNARDAMPAGGRLVIETASVVLDEAYARSRLDVVPGAYVMLVVSDSGLGMTPEVQTHLFEPFFTTKGQGKGTGLGLATCHGIVSQSRGHIGVYSEPGLGTTFRVYFPREDGAAPAEPGLAEVVTLRGGHETILLAEDEPAVRGLAALSLRSYGYRVLDAASGDEALSLAQEHAGPIALLVTDVVMPRMAGSELARRFADVRPGTRVLFMSGHAERAIAHQGVLEPGVEFLPKPFTPERLARKVREVLDAPRG